MAGIIRTLLDKIKNVLNPYFNSGWMGLIFGLLEQTIHIERTLIGLSTFLLYFFFRFFHRFILLGLFVILGIYLLIGWGNDIVCNFIGIAYPVYAS